MRRVVQTLRATNRSGQAVVEYLLILACVSIPLVCALHWELIPPLRHAVAQLAHALEG